MKTILYWFKRDLRLHDMPGLDIHDNSCRLLPIYIFDPRQTRMLKFGFPKMGNHRLYALERSVLALKERLQSLNSDLLILRGKPEELIPMLVDEFNVDCIHAETEIASEEVRILNDVRRKIPISMKLFESRSIFSEDELPWKLAELPNVFTDFRKKIEAIRGYDISVFPTTEYYPPLPDRYHEVEFPNIWEGPISEYVQQHPHSVICADIDELTGLERLQAYTYGNNGIATYKQTRNGMIGENYSSKFSPWLSIGALSVKHIMATINHYECEIQSNESTYWMKFELMWREFFYWSLKKHGTAFFKKEGIRNVINEGTVDMKIIHDWCHGETEDPYVNANMKELLLTGFMSNRGRQNVASYFVHQLKQDWRIGAAWFESRLLDYDVASNWGNWMYLAGVGNDPRQDRIFNTKKQAELYDPKSDYQSLWLSQNMAKNDY